MSLAMLNCISVPAGWAPKGALNAGLRESKRVVSAARSVRGCGGVGWKVLAPKSRLAWPLLLKLRRSVWSPLKSRLRLAAEPRSGWPLALAPKLVAGVQSSSASLNSCGPLALTLR